MKTDVCFTARRAMSARCRLAGAMLAACTVVNSSWAVAIASGSLTLNSFGVAPTTGSVVFTDPWTLTTFVQVVNSNGASNFGFQVDTSLASSSASVPFASAHGLASFPANNGQLAHVDGTVNFPDGMFGSASVLSSQSSLENSFMITGASGFVNVTFTASLSSILNTFTNPTGNIASSDVIFNLNVDGESVLSFFDLRVAGPGGSSSSTLSPNLSASISLDTSISHFLSLSLETDPTATSRVPDNSGTSLLVLLGLGVLEVGKRFRRGSSHACRGV